MRLDQLFTIKNGIASTGLNIEEGKRRFHLPYLRPASTQERTLSGWVWLCDIDSKDIYPPETLFVSTNGEGSHSYAYVSSFEFVANSDVSMLIPKRAMSLTEKLYYALCITRNRWRFSYGRKPKGKRLASIELPDCMPANFQEIDLIKYTGISDALDRLFDIPDKKFIKAVTSETKLVPLKSLFDIRYGNKFDLYKLEEEKGYIHFVTRSEKNNGVSAKVVNYCGIKPFEPGLITVALGGSVLASFVQQNHFYTAQNVKVLFPKREMNLPEKLYYCMIIKANHYRYAAMGREANKTLQDILVPKYMPDKFNIAYPNHS
jgi:Type I restriction modification DNA specificity domain